MAQYLITNEPMAIDFEGNTGALSRTLQNVKNLLMCRRGEVPFDRQRGLDPTIFDLPPDEFNVALLQELDRVMLWEKDAEIVSATWEFNDKNEVIISVIVETELED